MAADGFRRWLIALAVAVALLGLWIAWFLVARVDRLEVSQTARVEVEQAVRNVEPLVDGRIIATSLALGRSVQRDEVLVELEARPQQLERAEAQARLDALGPETARLREQIAVERRALDNAATAARAGLEQARAQGREADAAADLARRDAARLRELHAGGIIAEAEFQRANAEAERRLAAAEAQRAGVQRLAGEQDVSASERRARIEALERQIAHLDGEAGTLRAMIDRLTNEIERRKVRAVADGTLADVANVQVGTGVSVGQRLGTILPAGGPMLKVVAQFRPSESLGRVQPGQPARVRLDGFPWLQYGSLGAMVSHVAGEVRDGLVRVDLAIVPNPTSRIPLQHGLPGVVEIEIEKLSPAVLVLRAAGQLLTRPVAHPVAGDGS